MKIAVPTLAAAFCFLVGVRGEEAEAGKPGFGVDPAKRQIVQLLQKRLETGKDQPTILSKIGSIQLDIARRSGEHEDYAEAENSFRRLLVTNPDSLTARMGLAYTLIGRHRFSEALVHAREAANLRPDDSTILALLGDAHLALGNVLEAELFYTRLVEKNLTLQALGRIAQIHELRGELDQAATSLEEALEAGRLLGAPPVDLAWCDTMLGEFALNRGRLDDAEKHFRDAIEKDPQSPAGRRGLAHVLAERGAIEEAQDLLEELVREYPNPANWIALGDLLMVRSQDNQASKWYARAEADMLADMAKGDIGHLRELTELWLARGREIGRAALLALRDLDEVRQDAGAFDTAAWALHRAGRSEEAVRFCRLGLGRAKGNSRALGRAAVIHWAAGRRAEARLLLTRAKAINPSFPAGGLAAEAAPILASALHSPE